MLLATLYLLLFAILIWKIVCLLPLRISKSETLASSTILTVLFSGWLSFISWSIFGRIGRSIASMVVLIAALLTFMIFKPKKRIRFLKEPLPQNLIYRWIMVAIWAGLLLLFAWLSYNHFLRITVDGWSSAGYTWGDLPLHSSLISYFAEQPRISLNWPIYIGAKMFYPFITDLASAQLLAFGASWQFALGLPTFFLLSAAARLLFGFAFRLSKTIRASMLSLALILFSGSAGGVYYLLQDWIFYGADLLELDYTNLSESTQLNFANLVTSHLLPQRTYLLGFGCSMLILIIAYQIFHETKNTSKNSNWLVIASGFLIGLLPFAHAHSFLVIFGFMLIIGLVHAIRTRQIFNHWLKICATALIVAIPQLIWQFLTTPSGISKFHFGWMTPVGGNFIWFWILNLGVMFGLFVFVGILLILRSLKFKLKITSLTNGVGAFSTLLFIYGAFLFVLGNIYQFLPWIWDNIKFFTYAYIFMCIPVATVVSTWTKKTWQYGLVIFAVFVITAPGALAIYRDIKLDWVLFDNNSLGVADYIKTSTPSDAVILTSLAHNHPVTALAGRQVIMGNPGWLGTYGYDTSATQADLTLMSSGSDAAFTKMQEYNIDYIVINSQEFSGGGFNEVEIAKRAYLIKRLGEYSIYSVKSD